MPILDLLRCAVQIVVIALVIYYCYVFLRGTRAVQILIGLVAALVLYVCVSFFELTELGTIMLALVPVLPVILCVVFQPELRRLLAGIGERTSSGSLSSESVIETVVRSVAQLSKQRIGALIALERTASLRPYEQHGRQLDAPLVSELLVSIFYPHAPMHDGAAIVRAGRIAAAGCVFPVAIGKGDRRAYGTRHRAAIGITEETDAVVVVVSEETGLVSLAYRGELARGLGPETLRSRLGELMLAPVSAEGASAARKGDRP